MKLHASAAAFALWLLAGADPLPADLIPNPDNLPTALPVESITLSSPNTEVFVGQTLSLTVTLHFADGSESDVTGDPAVVYSSSDPTVMSVDREGQVRGLAWGQAAIHVAYTDLADIDGTEIVASGSLDLSVKLIQDRDDDGMTDTYESFHGFDPDDPADGGLDEDGDGLENRREFAQNTSPLKIDTDGDGVSDSDEIFMGSDPLAWPPQELDETWTVTVAGQAVQVNADGTFFIPNIAAPDQFGLGGPGTAPDFLSDNFVRLTGFSTAFTPTLYVFSAPFQIAQGEVFTVSGLTFTANPPRLIQSLLAIPDLPTLTAIGQKTRVRVTAFLGDGAAVDVTSRTERTIYRTSNPDLATVSPDGEVTAQGEGRVFITAVNEGATAVASIDIVPGDHLTTIVGVVQDADGQPVEGVTVRLVGSSATAVSSSTGLFQIEGVAASLALNGVIARTFGENRLFGFSGITVTSAGDLTDAGIIVVVPCEELGIDCTDSDDDCLPDSVENLLGLNPAAPDSDGNGVLDGDEDFDGDGLNNCAEILAGTDLRQTDTDGDGVSDGNEVLLIGSNPLLRDTDGDSLFDGDELALGTSLLITDTDGDLWNDESEVTSGSDPLDFNSVPDLMVFSRPMVRASVTRFEPEMISVLGMFVARPMVNVGVARFEGKLAFGTFVAQPRVSVGVPNVGEGISSFGMVVAKPVVSVGIPDTSNQGGTDVGIFVGRPLVRVEFEQQ